MIETLQQQYQALLRADALAVFFGIVIAVSGVVALLLNLLRVRSRTRQLLWFGIFALLYGVRLLVKTPSVQLLLGMPPRAGEYTENVITSVIVVPALLFAEDIYGRGWRSSLRGVVWVLMGLAVLDLVLIAVTRNPYAGVDPGVLLLVLANLVFLLSYLRGYRPPPNPYLKFLFVALSIFAITVFNEHLVMSGLLPWRLRIEPLGFFVVVCAMGYVASRRFLDSEQQLVSLEEEMRSARKIQNSILPPTVPQLPGISIAVRYSPMTAVAGDLYDFPLIGNDHLGVLIADVAGHGVPAALVASMIKVAAGAHITTADDPAAVMAGINATMCRQARGQYTTAGYLYVDLRRRFAVYSAAAHPPLLLWRNGEGRLREFKESGLLLGIRPRETYATMSLDLVSGDRILLYTDGLTEAADGDQLFGEHRLESFIASHEHFGADAFAGALLEEVKAWSPAQSDDITVLVIDVL